MKKLKNPIFHFTSWPGYLEMASYQLSFRWGSNFAFIGKTVVYVIPV